MALVLIGVFAGAGTTALHDWLRYRRDSDQRETDLRRATLVEFSAAVLRARAAHVLDPNTSQELEILSELAHKFSAINLVCPEVTPAAHTVHRAITSDKWADAMDAYEAAARQVLGIKEPPGGAGRRR